MQANNIYNSPSLSIQFSQPTCEYFRDATLHRHLHINISLKNQVPNVALFLCIDTSVFILAHRCPGKILTIKHISRDSTEIISVRAGYKACIFKRPVSFGDTRPDSPKTKLSDCLDWTFVIKGEMRFQSKRVIEHLLN